jgi:hypothetical protein
VNQDGGGKRTGPIGNVQVEEHALAAGTGELHVLTIHGCRGEGRQRQQKSEE